MARFLCGILTVLYTGLNKGGKVVKRVQSKQSVSITDLALSQTPSKKRRYLKKLIGSILMLPILVYFGFIGYVYFFPELVFYNPDKTKPNFSYAKSVIPTLHEVSYKTADGRDIYAWYATPKNPQKAVIFFHGNSYNIYYHIPRVLPFLKSGYTVILPEYEGFGGIEGTPSQRNMEDNMRATIKFLNDKGVQNKDIVLYGHSLGTYMATYVAAKLAGDEKFDALILESPFTSLMDVADIASYGLFPVKVVVRDKYNSYDLIDKIGTRLMIAHGTEDPTVPYELGVKLFEKATGQKRFYGVKGANHRNLPENGFLDEALKWLGYPRPVQAQPLQTKAPVWQAPLAPSQSAKSASENLSGKLTNSQAPSAKRSVVYASASLPENRADFKTLSSMKQNSPAEFSSGRTENLTGFQKGTLVEQTYPATENTPPASSKSSELSEGQNEAGRVQAFEEEAVRAEFGQNRPIRVNDVLPETQY